MNRQAKSDMTDLISKVLADAGVPLSTSQIMESLPTGADRDAISALISARKKAGEIVASIVDGRPAYALVSGFVKASVGSKPGVPKPRGAKESTSRPSSPPAAAEPPPIATAPASDDPPPAAVPNPALRPAAKAKPFTSFGLLDRLDAIATDIEDAIGDSIDQALLPQAIKALVAAAGGLRRAVHLIHRS